MPDTLEPNLNLLAMATGTASGQWGADLNTGMIAIVDSALGSQQSVSLASTDVTLTMAQRQNLSFNCTGTLTANVAVKLPLQTANTSIAVGGFFLFTNNTTGAFTVTVKTAVSGSTGVTVPQGVTTEVYSDTVNVLYADNAQNRTPGVRGNPNGQLAGTAAGTATSASRVIDFVTNNEYICTSSGTASSAAWSLSLPYAFPSQGYLTLNSSVVSPILTTDSTAATTLYFTSLLGNLFWVYNGVSMSPVAITSNQMQLALSSSAQAANGLYDVIGFLQNGNGTATLGFSPAWQTATAGSSARGTGAGTPQLTRVTGAGVLVNAVQQTVNNGATTYTVAANRGTLLGTVYVDSTAGQVTCHRTWGQARKWGVANYYNRQSIVLKAGDTTSTWTVPSTGGAKGTAVFRPSNNNSANSVLTTLNCLAEEPVQVQFMQNVVINSQGGTAGRSAVAIGNNSVSVASGYVSGIAIASIGPPPNGYPLTCYGSPPWLGLSTFNSLESGDSNGWTAYGGSEAYMILSATWRA